MSELKPCPFCCERKRVGLRYDGVEYRWGHCRACDAEGPVCETEAEAIAAWNRRPDAPSAGEGWVLVPVEPSDAMIETAEEEISARSQAGGRVYAADIYRAMIATLPAPPQADGAQG